MKQEMSILRQIISSKYALKCTQCTFERQKTSDLIFNTLITLMHTPHAHALNKRHKRLARGLRGGGDGGQFTSKSPLVEALLDAVGSAHVEGLGDLLVHETLPVEHVRHHHPQVKHLQQLGDGGHLHQISPALVQAARVQVLKHRLEPVSSSSTSDVCSFQSELTSQFHKLFSSYSLRIILANFRSIISVSCLSDAASD